MRGNRAMADHDKVEAERAVPGSPRSFNWFLQRIGNGSVVYELTQKLGDIGAGLAQSFQDFRGKPKARLVITIDFTMDKGVVNVEAKYTVKLPAPPAAGALMWIDAANNFTEDNPNQLNMFRGPRAVGE